MSNNLQIATIKDLFRQQLIIMGNGSAEVEEFLQEEDDIEEVLIDDSLANVVTLFLAGDMENLTDILLYTRQKLNWKGGAFHE